MKPIARYRMHHRSWDGKQDVEEKEEQESEEQEGEPARRLMMM